MQTTNPKVNYFPIAMTLLGGLLVHSNQAIAEEANKVFSLDEIIVTTSTKTERKLLDVPVRTEVVSKQELEKTHSRDVAEALKNVPGLLLKRIHGKSGEEVWLQGLDANRVLVLIDGKPVSASTGSSVDLSQISIGDVDHIEIVKGAASVLYGSEAMGGVVNIITTKNDKPFSYSLVVDTGSYGDRNVGDALNDKHVKLNLSGKRGQWRVNFNADARDKQGTDLDKSTWSHEGDAGRKANLAFEVGYTAISGANFKIKPTYYNENLSRNFSSFSPGIGDIKKVKREEATRQNITLSYAKPLANGSKLTAWYMHEKFEDTTGQDVVSTAFSDQQRKGQTRFDKAEIQWDKAIGDKQLLTIGMVGLNSSLAQLQTKRTASGATVVDEINGEQTRSSLELYVQDDIFVSDSLEILPGFRYQNDSDFGSHWAPKISALYSPEWSEKLDTKLRFSIGQGYRVPTLKDRHYVFDHSALGYMVLGNPDLQPETSTSYNASLELSNQESFRVEVGLFRNDIKDLISTELDSDETTTDLIVYRYANIGRAKTQGLDLTARYKINSQLAFSGSYNYLEATDAETAKQLTQRPEHQVKLQLDYQIPRYKADVSLYGNYQSKEFVDSDNAVSSPAYSTFDLKINKTLRKGTKLFFGIDNILNTHRDVPLTGNDYRPESGRFIYTGIRFDG